MSVSLKISYFCTSGYSSLCPYLWVDILPIYTACQFHASDNTTDSRQVYAYLKNRWRM